MAIRFFWLMMGITWAGSVFGTNDTLSDPIRIPFARLILDNGKLLRQDQPFLESVDKHGHTFSRFVGMTAEYGWQTVSGKHWYSVCNYPRVGIGARYIHVVNRTELGQPVIAYGFLEGNLYRSKRVSVTTRYSVGLGYSNPEYGTHDTLINDILSTKVNLYAGLGAGMQIRLSDRFFLEPFFRISHLSNGNIREPQKGLNMISWSLSLNHHFRPSPYLAREKSGDTPSGRHEVVAFVSLAPRQLEFYEPGTKEFIGTYGLNYLMGTLHAGYNYSLNHRIKLSTGFDVFYDGTNGQLQLALTGIPRINGVPFEDKMKLAAFAGWESVLGNLSIVGNFIYVITEKRFYESSPAFKQRLGFKYHFMKDVFAGLNVRATNFRVAEMLEFNVGMRKQIGSGR